MKGEYKVVCKGRKPEYFDLKITARNHALNLRAMGFPDADVQYRRVILNRHTTKVTWEPISIRSDDGKVSCVDAKDEDFYRNVTFTLSRRTHNKGRECIATHLANKTGPLTRKETYMGMEQEEFTTEFFIIPVLKTLGYRSRIPHGGNGNGDILLTFGNKSVVVECKPLDVYNFGTLSEQTHRYHLQNKANGCLGCILTDGARWMLTTDVDGELQRSETVDIREMAKYLFGKNPREEDAQIFAGRMKELMDVFFIDNVERSFEKIREKSKKPAE